MSSGSTSATSSTRTSLTIPKELLTSNKQKKWPSLAKIAALKTMNSAFPETSVAAQSASNNKWRASINKLKAFNFSHFC